MGISKPNRALRLTHGHDRDARSSRLTYWLTDVVTKKDRRHRQACSDLFLFEVDYLPTIHRGERMHLYQGLPVP